MERVATVSDANLGVPLRLFPETAQTRLWQRLGMAAGFAAYLALLAGAGWVISHHLPDQASFTVLGRSIALHDIHQKIFSNATLLFAILPSVLWLECALVGWRKSSARQLLALTPTIRTDIACLVLDQAHLMGQIGRLMMLGLSIISGSAIAAWAKSEYGFAISLSFLPLVVQVVVYFYAYSFLDYCAHRLGHTPWFWPLHRYHHSAEEFTVINATRIHPAGFVGIFLINIPMAVLGAPADVIIWVNAITVALGFVIHSRIDSDFGWVGRYLIQSPLHHRLHHKLDMTTPTGHFAMAPVWDHLFGGWGGEAHVDMPIGVDTAYRHGFWVMPDLLRDYVDFFKGLVGKRTLSQSERL